MRKVFISSDHAGYQLKEQIKKKFSKKFIFDDLGTYDSKNSVNYPDYAHKLCKKVSSNSKNFGILVCGSGIGMSIAVNRYEWVRGALVHDETTARLCREHNDANVIILGERIIGELTAISCVNIFLNTSFLGGRHQKRINKLRNSKMLMSPQEN